MNYEKKYREALDRARDLMTNQNPPAFDKHLIEIVFPELKESEDERIRKELIDFIKHESYMYGIKTWCHGYTTEEIISWLEKQGEAPVTINIDKIDKMVRDYANTKERGNERFGKPTNCMIRAYRQGLTDAISTLNVEKKPTADAKQLDSSEVIEWLKPYGCVVDDIVEQFKKDFGL